MGNEVVGEEVRVASFKGKGERGKFASYKIQGESYEKRGARFESVAAILHRVLAPRTECLNS